MSVFRAAQAGVSSTKPLEVSLVASGATNNNRRRYTYSSLSVGSADAGRAIVISLTHIAGGRHFGFTTNFGFTTVTLGGVTATKLVSNGVAGTEGGLWIVELPTGTTATLVASLTGFTSRFSYALYRVLNLQSLTPVDTAAASDVANVNVNVNTPTGDGVLFAAGAAKSCTNVPTWTGVDASYRFRHDSNTQSQHGMSMTTAEELPRTVKGHYVSAIEESAVAATLQ